MSLHLQPLPTDAIPPLPLMQIEPVYFVILRQNGHWSPAAKIIAVYASESDAEAAAASAKIAHPHQTYGVAALRSEAREVAHPIEIVRVTEGDA